MALIKKIVNLQNNLFFKNIFLLFTGASIAQIIPVAASFVLARLYTERDYGDLSVFMSAAGIAGIIATFRYELAIILARKNNAARNLLALCLFNSLIVGLLLLIAVHFCYPILKAKLEISNATTLYLIPLMAILYGFYNTFENWFNRLHAYKNMAFAKIIYSLISSLAKIGLGFLAIHLGLIYGTLLGYVFAISLFLFLFCRNGGKRLLHLISFYKMKQLFHEFHDFFRYATPSGILNACSNIGLPLLISYFYSIEWAGIYFFASTTILQPIQLLFTSISQVYKKEANTYYVHSKEKLIPLTHKIQKGIFMLLFPALLILSIFGGQIFGFLFGEKWIESGEMIKYFAILVLLNANYSPISSIGDILRKQKFMLFFNFSMICWQVILLVLFSNKITFPYMILLISISGAIHFLYIDIYMKRYIKKLLTYEKNH